jgi:hypothetical protein
MSKIKLYNRLEPHTELGQCAELICDNLCYDVSNMGFREMLVIYEPYVLLADKAVLKSSDIGTWQYNKTGKRWERK